MAINKQSWRTGTRVAASFAIVLLFLVALTIVGITRVDRINAGLAVINDVNAVKETYAVAFRGSVHDRSIALRDVVLASPAELPGLVAHVDHLNADYQRVAGPMDAIVEARADKAGIEKSLLSHIKLDEVAATRLIGAVISQQAAGNAPEARHLLDEARPAFVAWLDDINKFIDFEEQLSRDQAADTRHVGLTFEWLMVALTIVAIVLGSVIAWLITRYITRALGGEPLEVNRLADSIRDGDLSHDASVGHSGEKSIMATMGRMRASLRAVVTQVRHHADGVASASVQIAERNTALSARTESQATALQETSASMEQLTSTVAQNSDSARQASALATTAAQVAERGSYTVKEVVDTMADISASSSHVADIIAVIEGIAFQTNILALNAAVEAARAGEQGRGFAVVAGEVRGLAQRSATAAKEIKDLIGDSLRRVSSGSEKVQAAGTTMAEILDSIQKLNNIVGEIAAASAEQQIGIEQVGEAILRMDESIQQNAGMVEEASQATRTLEEEARALRHAVARFKVDEQSMVSVVDRPPGHVSS
jgi:methyl-accepting chemotaxis protein